MSVSVPPISKYRSNNEKRKSACEKTNNVSF